MDLKSMMQRLATAEGLTRTGIEGFDLYRMDKPYERTSTMLVPAVCFILQGRKTVYLGSLEIVYDERNYLIGSTKIPVESELKEASPEKPYLGIVIHIDPALITELLVNMDEFNNWPDQTTSDRIITDAPIDQELEENLLRLLKIVGNPLKVKILGKALIREVFFNILSGERGYVLRNCVLHHAKAHKIVPIIQYLENNFTQPIEINDVAKYAGMSASSLYSQFKSATSLSPIQFIKRIRLHHAYSLLMEGASPREASEESGYGSQSQFSREFKRQFGYSPSRVKEQQ